MVSRQSKTALVAGEIFSLPTVRGTTFLQFLGIHASLGAAVVAGTGFFDEDCAPSASAFDNGFVVFYPLEEAVRRGLVRKCGYAQPRPMPTVFRRTGALDHSGRIISWIIDDGETRVVRTVLSPEERKVAQYSVWMHPLLVDRLMADWRPETAEVD